VLVVLIALVGIYAIVSKEERPTLTAAARDVPTVGDVRPAISSASTSNAPSKAQTTSARLVDADNVVPSESYEGIVPVSTSIAPAAAPNRLDTRSPSSPQRAAASAKTEPVAEEIPLDWMITGSNIEGYKLRTERVVVLSGSASAVLESDADTDTSRFGALMQMASAKSFKGKRIELSGYVASVDAPAGVSIWLRADDASGTVVAFENTLPRGLRGTQEWTYQNIVMDIPKEAVALVYGAVLNARGKLYVDDLQFRVVDTSVAPTAKPITPAPHLAQGTRADPGREPRNLDFEETRIKTE